MGKTIKRVVVGALQTNCYILRDEAGGDIAVIDPGGQADSIEKELGQEIGSVKLILLTHFHIDHIMAVNELKSKTGAEIFIHSLDADSYHDDRNNGSVWLFGRPFLPKKADVLLSDGDILHLGELEIKVLHTPGHSPGGCCFICEDVIFSGDTLFYGSVGRVDLPGGDQEAMESSLMKLARLEWDFRVLPGHGEETTLAFEREYNPYMRRLI